MPGPRQTSAGVYSTYSGICPEPVVNGVSGIGWIGLMLNEKLGAKVMMFHVGQCPSGSPLIKPLRHDNTQS